MTHVAHKIPVLDDNVDEISQQTENKTTPEAEILDIFTGEQADLKKVRIKIGSAEEQSIRLLQEHYSKVLGRDVTMSQLIAILVNKQLNDSLNIDLSFMKTALRAGMTVKMPKVSIPHLGGNS